MNIDELKSALTSDEGKALLKELAQPLIEAETRGLKDKNKELIEQDRKRKEKLDAAEAEKERLADEASTAEAKKKGDFETLTKNLEAKFAKDLAKANERAEGYKGQMERLLIDGGITDALTKSNIAPQFLDGARALIKGNKIEITDGENGPVAQIGGKALSDYVSEWSQGDAGKHYIAGEDNSGGNSQSSGRNDSGKAGGGKKRADMNARDITEYIEKHGEAAFQALPK